MPRGKRKQKRELKIHYNLRAARFFSDITGRFVSEKTASDFSPYEALLEREIAEQNLEDLFDEFGEYFDDIEELRKFGPDLTDQRIKGRQLRREPLGEKKDIFFFSKSKKFEKEFLLDDSQQFAVDHMDDFIFTYDEFLDIEQEYG